LSVSLSTPSQRNRSCPQIPPCATSGQAEMLKKLYAGDAAQTVWEIKTSGIEHQGSSGTDPARPRLSPTRGAEQFHAYY